MQLSLPTPESTDALGAALAVTLPVDPVVAHLIGDLGAGKSTLARALLRALGVQGSIRSPTYTLVERYSIARGEALHLDLYRIGDAGELEFLGLDVADAALWLVEWPERAAGGAMPPVDLEVQLAIEGDGRSAALTARSPAAERWIASAVSAFTPLNLQAQRRKSGQVTD